MLRERGANMRDGLRPENRTLCTVIGGEIHSTGEPAASVCFAPDTATIAPLAHCRMSAPRRETSGTTCSIVERPHTTAAAMTDGCPMAKSASVLQHASAPPSRFQTRQSPAAPVPSSSCADGADIASRSDGVSISLQAENSDPACRQTPSSAWYRLTRSAPAPAWRTATPAAPRAVAAETSAPDLDPAGRQRLGGLTV